MKLKWKDDLVILWGEIYNPIENKKMKTYYFKGSRPFNTFTQPIIGNDNYVYVYIYDHDTGCWIDEGNWQGVCDLKDIVKNGIENINYNKYLIQCLDTKEIIYWRSNKDGYTPYIWDAGIYKKDELVNVDKSKNKIIVLTKDLIQEGKEQLNQLFKEKEKNFDEARNQLLQLQKKYSNDMKDILNNLNVLDKLLYDIKMEGEDKYV